MLEIEAKFRVADRAAVVAKLASLAAAWVADRIDEDQYFNAPDRDFRQTDEAFRLRRIGDENRLTYKGPKRPVATKTRTEIEVRFADGESVAADTARMLGALGYRPVAIVRKQRTVYHLSRGTFAIEVCLDEVDRVGTFAEVEVVAEESQAAEAETVVLAVAAELGLTQREQRSYLSMVLEKKS